MKFSMVSNNKEIDIKTIGEENLFSKNFSLRQVFVAHSWQKLITKLLTENLSKNNCIPFLHNHRIGHWYDLQSVPKAK